MLNWKRVREGVGVRDGGDVSVSVGVSVAVAGCVAAGAAIYVCGSLDGMAGGVDTVLREVLGAAQVEALIEEGRYRRDVY